MKVRPPIRDVEKVADLSESEGLIATRKLLEGRIRSTSTTGATSAATAATSAATPTTAATSCSCRRVDRIRPRRQGDMRLGFVLHGGCGDFSRRFTTPAEKSCQRYDGTGDDGSHGDCGVADGWTRRMVVGPHQRGCREGDSRSRDG